MHQSCKWKNQENRQADKDMQLKDRADIGDIKRGAALEGKADG